MKVDAICELVLESGEPERLERFYLDLGLERLTREDDRIWLRVGDGARIGIWTPGPKEHDDRGGRHVHFALSLPPDTLDELTARLRAAGRQVEGPIEHDGGDRSIYLTDPEGNVVELWDLLERGAGAREGIEATAD